MAGKNDQAQQADPTRDLLVSQQEELTDRQRRAVITAARAQVAAEEKMDAGFEHDEGYPGGYYIVDGQAVDCDGVPVEKPASKAKADDGGDQQPQEPQA